MREPVKSTQTQTNDERINHAFNAVKGIAEENESFQKDFRSAVRSFPTMVHNNGLSAAIAFLRVKMGDKEENHYNLLHDTLEQWLVQASRLKENGSDEKTKDLLEAVINLSLDEYRIITKEVMLYSQWIKRFAEGMLSKDEQKQSSSK